VARVEFDLDADLPLVPCLVSEFNQVILNLIVNAADAIAEIASHDEFEGVIRVSSRIHQGLAEICVEDNGPGMTPQVKARIFDPFFTTKPVGKGTGQGLAICHNVIVNKHGGQLECDTAPGRGARFIVRLPIAGRKQRHAA
jgi:signal transduction histidine kinase